jgi:hypothetical protein
MAKDLYEKLEDYASIARIDSKSDGIIDIEKVEDDRAKKEADKLVADADKKYDMGTYVDAKDQYIEARKIYDRLNNDIRSDEVSIKIDNCDKKIRGF